MKHYTTSQLPNWDLKGNRILVRADLNTPRAQDGTLQNDFKLQALLPTLEYLQTHGAYITLISHCGRPLKQEKQLSLEPCVNWFNNHNLSFSFAPTLIAAQDFIKINPHQHILVENLRFFPEEIELNQTFAQKLAQLGTFFVQDAFGTLHRNQTSITLLPQNFDHNHKTIGFLVEKELTLLNTLITNPILPFVLIIGGNKITTKLPVITHLLDSVTTILVLPALAFTFLKAQGKAVGKSLVDDTYLQTAQSVLKKAKTKEVEIILPVDFVVTPQSFEKPVPIKIKSIIGPEMTGISFGPATAYLFKKVLTNARTIFLNGMSGNEQYPETLEGMRILFQILEQSNAHTIIGGGNAVATAQQCGLTTSHSTFLTGGGATLTYLSQQELPGLKVLS